MCRYGISGIFGIMCFTMARLIFFSLLVHDTMCQKDVLVHTLKEIRREKGEIAHDVCEYSLELELKFKAAFFMDKQSNVNKQNQLGQNCEIFFWTPKTSMNMKEPNKVEFYNKNILEFLREDEISNLCYVLYDEMAVWHVIKEDNCTYFGAIFRRMSLEAYILKTISLQRTKGGLAQGLDNLPPRLLDDLAVQASDGTKFPDLWVIKEMKESKTDNKFALKIIGTLCYAKDQEKKLVNTTRMGLHIVSQTSPKTSGPAEIIKVVIILEYIQLDMRERLFSIIQESSPTSQMVDKLNTKATCVAAALNANNCAGTERCGWDEKATPVLFRREEFNGNLYVNNDGQFTILSKLLRELIPKINGCNGHTCFGLGFAPVKADFWNIYILCERPAPTTSMAQIKAKHLQPKVKNRNV